MTWLWTIVYITSEFIFAKKNKLFFDSILNNSFFDSILNNSYITSKCNFWKKKNKKRKKEYKNLIVILLILNKSTKCWLFCFADFEQVVILLTAAQLVRPPSVTYPLLCSTCVTYGMLRHWSPATSHPPFYRECYGFERALFTRRRFLPYTPSCFFQSFSGSWQFNLKVSRASCWSSKHSPGPTICLNHSNPQKFYTGRFYLGVMAGRLMKNLLLTGFKLFSR